MDVNGKLAETYLDLCETRRVAELSKLAGFVSEDTAEIFVYNHFGPGHTAISGGSIYIYIHTRYIFPEFKKNHNNFFVLLQAVWSILKSVCQRKLS